VSRILFAVPSLARLKGFENTLMRLAERGHIVRIATKMPGDTQLPARLSTHDDRISVTESPSRRSDEWRDSIVGVRGVRNYLRYLAPGFEHAEKLRKRALLEFIKTASDGALTQIAATCGPCGRELKNDKLAHMLEGLGQDGLNALETLFRTAEEDIPSDAGFDAFLSREQPDVVLVAPLVSLESGQADLVKSARTLRIPSALPVVSIDSLSTEGLVTEIPDKIFAWNERQAREAVELHGVPCDRVTITGAPQFDAFFDEQPARSRNAFCMAYGLDYRMPVLAYVCSSEFVAKDESVFVGRWIDAVRRHPLLGECGIVIRPHPRARRTWDDYAPPPRVALARIKDRDDRGELHDVLCHSNAVVALNTGAWFEAAILGKPVFTILAPEYAGGQAQTLHFHYLLRDEGGFVEPAASLDVHLEQLAGALASPPGPGHLEQHVQRFLRPGGLALPASHLLADAIESLAG